MTTEYYYLAIELISLQVKHCIGVADIMGFNPVQFCFLGFFFLLNCDGLLFINYNSRDNNSFLAVVFIYKCVRFPFQGLVTYRK